MKATYGNVLNSSHLCLLQINAYDEVNETWRYEVYSY